MTTKLKGRLVFLMIIVIGLAPLIAAVVWYENTDDWRPAETGNNGTLITPARAIQPAALPLLGGGTLPTHWFRNSWSLVYAGPGTCPAYCKKALYLTRQVRLTMGSKMIRVQRLFIVDDAPQHARALRRAHPDITVVNAGGANGHAFLSQFHRAPDQPRGHKIWLVDPQGRLMMAYNLDGVNVLQKGTAIAEDLRHLLRY